MSNGFAFLLLLIHIFLLTLPAESQTIDKRQLQKIESALESKYKDKVLQLRHFQKGDYLRYTKSGALIHALDEGTWTLYSLLEIKDIKIKDDRVEFRGQRRAVTFDPKQNRLQQHRTWMGFRAEIEYGDSGPEQVQIEKALQAIFLTSQENLADFVPEYWKGFLLKTTPRLFDDSADAEGRYINAPIPDVYKVGNGVTVPKLLKKVDPQMSQEAQQAKLEGTVGIRIIIMKDGSTNYLELFQPLGLGLDEEAMAAVKQWKFTPAMKGNEPVHTRAHVEVSFAFRR